MEAKFDVNRRVMPSGGLYARVRGTKEGGEGGSGRGLSN